MCETVRTFGGDRQGDSSTLAADAVGWHGAPLCVADLNEKRYSPPMWAPFSATERRMSRTKNISSWPIAAEKEKTSKKTSDNACRPRECSRTPNAI